MQKKFSVFFLTLMTIEEYLWKHNERVGVPIGVLWGTDSLAVMQTCKIKIL